MVWLITGRRPVRESLHLTEAPVARQRIAQLMPLAGPLPPTRAPIPPRRKSAPGRRTPSTQPQTIFPRRAQEDSGSSPPKLEEDSERPPCLRPSAEPLSPIEAAKPRPDTVPLLPHTCR